MIKPLFIENDDGSLKGDNFRQHSSFKAMERVIKSVCYLNRALKDGYDKDLLMREIVPGDKRAPKQYADSQI